MSYDTNCVYIMSSVNNKVLYVGVTSDLIRRTSEHRQCVNGGFTSKYKVFKLVYFECGGDIISALNREKQIKANSRTYKEKLIRSINPEWRDLAEDWY
jgi:putative endonuclease